MNEEKQSGNGNVISYRVGELEEGMTETRRDVIRLHAEHEARIRTIEDFVTREGAGGVPLRYIWLITGIVASIIGAIVTGILKYSGLN